MPKNNAMIRQAMTRGGARRAIKIIRDLEFKIVCKRNTRPVFRDQIGLLFQAIFFWKLEMEKFKLTQKKLKEILCYDQKTGIFTWKKSRGRAARGDRAGNLNSYGYIDIKINKKLYKASRLAFLYMDGYMPDIVDHIDRKRNNNKWSNLRDTNIIVNVRNKTNRNDSTSGITGVNYDINKRKWRVRIINNYNNISFGNYKIKHDAIMARYCAELKYGWHEVEIHTDAKEYVNNFFGRV